jgi:hypothetical protein
VVKDTQDLPSYSDGDCSVSLSDVDKNNPNKKKSGPRRSYPSVVYSPSTEERSKENEYSKDLPDSNSITRERLGKPKGKEDKGGSKGRSEASKKVKQPNSHISRDESSTPKVTKTKGSPKGPPITTKKSPKAPLQPKKTSPPPKELTIAIKTSPKAPLQPKKTSPPPKEPTVVKVPLQSKRTSTPEQKTTKTVQEVEKKQATILRQDSDLDSSSSEDYSFRFPDQLNDTLNSPKPRKLQSTLSTQPTKATVPSTSVYLDDGSGSSSFGSDFE